MQTILKLNTDQQRRPFGGHHYPEPGMVIRAEKFEDLVRKLTDYRITNGKAVGTPERDVLVYYAREFPYMIKHEKGSYSTENADSPYVRFRHWVHTVWKNPPAKAITKKEASTRWDVCKTCPFNVKKDWPKTEESQELERRVFMLRLGIDVPKELGFCALHRADIGVMSFIETPSMFSAKDKAKPDHKDCWVSSLAGR